MAQSNITYLDKVTSNPQPSIPDINKVTGVDMTEIKTVVNDNATDTQTQLDTKADLALIQSNVIESNNITFTNVIGDYFGKFAVPRTGALTIDNTNAVTGAISVVYYQNSTLDIDVTPIFIKGDALDPIGVNVLYIIRDADDNYTVNIIANDIAPVNNYTFAASFSNETYATLTGVTTLQSNEYIEIKTTFTNFSAQRPFFGNQTLISDFAGIGNSPSSVFLSKTTNVGNINQAIAPALVVATNTIIRITNVNNLSLTLTVDGTDYTGLALNQLGEFNQMFRRGDGVVVIDGYHHDGSVEYIDFNGDILRFTNTTKDHQSDSGLITMEILSGNGADVTTLFTQI